MLHARHLMARTDLGVFALPAGLAVAAVTVLSPLDDLGRVFFSAHMFQHLLLILAAAPLLAWSRQVRRLMAGLEGSSASPWVAATLLSAVVLFWHLPAAHDWATFNRLAHALEVLTVIAAATGFWRLVVFSEGESGRAVSVVIVWLVSLQGALLSAIIMFAPSPLCAAYADNPLSDQVLAGLLMCIPASLAYAASSVFALVLLFRQGAHRAE